MLRIDNPECTELESHLIQYYTEIRKGTGFEDSIDNYNQHVLQEFVNAYSTGNYSEDEEDKELIDKFLRIAKSDINGNHQYNYDDFTFIVHIINNFGL